MIYENAEKEDVLNRKRQINDIKTIIDDSFARKTSFTLAVNGGWGCGKTFFLNELAKEYDDNSFVFYYDAWANNYYEEPLIGLLDCLRQKLNEITRTNNLLKAIALDALKIIIGFFDVALESKIGFKPLKSIGKIKNYIDKKRKESELGDSFNPYSDLSNAKTAIVKALDKLSNSGRRVIILIDELDRCDPRYAMRILERIHHISSFTCSFLIVAVDKEQLDNSIKNVYSHGNNEIATHYLRKIVDMTYDLGNGLFDKNKHNILFGQLESLFTIKNNALCNEDDVLLFEYCLFQDLDIRRIEKLINYTIVNHKLVFRDQLCSPIIMCGELLLGWALFHITNKKEILSEMSKEYSNNKNNSIYGFIRNKISNNYLSSTQTFDEGPLIIVNNLVSYLFYVVKAANRKTIRVDFELNPVVAPEQNTMLLECYLKMIVNSNI